MIKRTLSNHQLIHRCSKRMISNIKHKISNQLQYHQIKADHQLKIRYDSLAIAEGNTLSRYTVLKIIKTYREI